MLKLLNITELVKRFISDYDLPIPVIDVFYDFFYHLDLYEEDYGAMTKYKALRNLIDERYNGDSDRFLKEYYDIRDRIINSITDNVSFKRFNTMDMSVYAVKDRPDISSNNIYNINNVGKFFISVDLKKANFQTLKKIDKDIVFGADTYEDFIGKFTDLDYVKESKYTRQVIFGKCNPKRHITAEKYFIVQIYRKIIEKFPYLSDKCVSLSNDEMIFEVDYLMYNDKLKCFSLRNDIETIVRELGFDVRIEFFHLRGYNLLLKRNGSVRKTFFKKDYFCTDGSFKLICVPLQYHSICYKLYKGMDLNEIDYHFEYEGMNARFYEEFDIEEIKQ